MMETSELSPWGVVALALVAACALAPGAGGQVAGPAYVTVAIAPTQPPPGVDGLAYDDPLHPSAKVCISCTGVAAADGHVYATIYLTLDPTVAVADFRLTGIDLLDEKGNFVAHGSPTDYNAVVTAAHNDIGPFSGRIAAGAHTVLWIGSELHVIGGHGLRAPPTHYRLYLNVNNGPHSVDGALEPQGPTA